MPAFLSYLLLGVSGRLTYAMCLDGMSPASRLVLTEQYFTASYCTPSKLSKGTPHSRHSEASVDPAPGSPCP